MSPGPWEFYDRREVAVISLPGLRQPFSVYSAAAPGELTIPVADNMTGPDARATAALPDLIAACREIYEGAEDKGLLDHEAFVNMVEALEKATGEEFEL
jgi:hypothetical protein